MLKVRTFEGKISDDCVRENQSNSATSTSKIRDSKNRRVIPRKAERSSIFTLSTIIKLFIIILSYKSAAPLERSFNLCLGTYWPKERMNKRH
jgi:hypothetical protein